MRVALIGVSPMGVMTAEALSKGGHDVVVIDTNEDKIKALAERLDCAFIHGDATRPAILREVGPSNTDLLFCLTGDDAANILASLVGRSLGFARIVTKIEDPEFEHVCIELGLTDTIIPDRYMARMLADLAVGIVAEDFASFFKQDVRLFSFVARDQEAGPVSALGLPEQARVILLYRGDAFVPADPDTEIKPDDEVVVVTHEKSLAKLRERWSRRPPV